MNYDKILVNILTTKNGTINSNLIKKINSKYINVKNYLLNRFEFVESITESYNRIKNNIEIRPICPICSNRLKYYKNITYSKTCSNKCGKILRNKTYYENTGYTSPMQDRNVRDKVSNYYKEHKEVIVDKNEKFKSTCLSRYGVTAPAKSTKIKEKIKNTCLEKYGVDNVLKSEEIKNKIKETNINRYGNIYPQTSDEIRNKLSERLSSIDVREKVYNTKKMNGTFNISNIEDKLYELLKENFNNVIRQYKSDKYPFNCDFYLPDFDLYIEYQGSWTHGSHPFNMNSEEDLMIVKLWESKNSEYYNNAIDTWTNRDVIKRNTAINNELNWLEYFDEDLDYIIDDIKNFIDNYRIEYSKTELLKELKYYKNSEGKLSGYSKYNLIVKQFQQDTFYKEEKKYLKNPYIKSKLINNRKKYLDKDIFTNDELLTGFKKSGIYYGYSHFNPLIFKWFIDKYNIKTCYDPFGGWGHRLLGAQNLDRYIYNDLSKSTYKNVNNIIDYFNITNTITYNEDARTFIPNEEFEAIFTCPPYYNVEKYECGEFSSIKEYECLIQSIFDLYYKNDNIKILGIVIREDLINNDIEYTEKILIKTNKSNLINNKQFDEYLYILKK